MKKILLVLSLILCLFFLTCCEDGKVSADKIKQAGDALAKTGNSAEAQRIIVENAQTEVEELVDDFEELVEGLVEDLEELKKIEESDKSKKTLRTENAVMQRSSLYAKCDDILQKFNSLSAKYSHNDEAWEKIRAYLYEDNLQDGEQSIITEKFKALCDDANAYAREEGVALLKTLLLFLVDYDEMITIDVKGLPVTINLDLSLRDFLDGMKNKFTIEKPSVSASTMNINLNSGLGQAIIDTIREIFGIIVLESSSVEALRLTPFNSGVYYIKKFEVYDAKKEREYTADQARKLKEEYNQETKAQTVPTSWDLSELINWVGENLNGLIPYFTEEVNSDDIKGILEILGGMNLKIKDVSIALDYSTFGSYSTEEQSVGLYKYKTLEKDNLKGYTTDNNYEKRFTLAINDTYKDLVGWKDNSSTIKLGNQFKATSSSSEQTNPSKPSIPGTSNPTDVTMDGITDDAISTLLSMLLSMYGEVLTDYGDGKLYSVASLLNDLYFINALATVETVITDLGSALNDTDSELFNSTYKDFFKGITLDDYQLTYDSFATQENSGKIIKLLLELSKGHYFPQQNEVLYHDSARDDANCPQIMAIATFYENLMNIEAETVLKYFNEIEGIASNLDSAMKYNRNLYLYSEEDGQTAYNMSDKVKAIYKASESAPSIPTANIIALLNCSSTDPSETLSYALYKIDDNEIVEAIRYNLKNENLNLDIDSFLDGTIEKLLKSLNI